MIWGFLFCYLFLFFGFEYEEKNKNILSKNLEPDCPENAENDVE